MKRIVLGATWKPCVKPHVAVSKTTDTCYLTLLIISNSHFLINDLLFTSFAEPDRSIVSAAKLRKLTQGSQTVFSYASDFRLLASNLDWNNAAVINQFRFWSQ